MRLTRSLTIGAALVVTAAATWTLAQATGASAAGGGNNLEFFIQDTKQVTLKVTPSAKDPAQGDLFSYHGVVYDKKNGKKIGNYGGQCIQLDAAGGTTSDSSCNVDYVLPGGQLHTEAYGTNELLFSGSAFPFSILGGTGKYRDARGEGTIRIPPEVKDSTDGYVKIKLDG